MIDDTIHMPDEARIVPPALPPLSDFRASNAVERKLMLSKYWARLFNGAHANRKELLFIPLEANGIILGNGTFGLILVTPEDFSPNDCAVKNLDELYPYIEEKVGEALSEYSINYVFEFGGTVVAVTCFPRALSPEGLSDVEFIQPLYMDVFNKLVREARERDKLPLRVCVSDLFSDANRIPRMFRYMHDVMTYDEMFLRELGSDSVTAVRGLEPDYGVDHEALHELAGSLCELVGKGEESPLRERLSTAADYLVCETPHSLAHFFMRVQLLMCIVWQRLFGAGDELCNELQSIISRLQSSRSHAELKDGLEAVFMQLLEQRRYREQCSPWQFSEIVEYIGENISQPWLSAQAVSERLGMSPSLLSLRFKNEFGQRLVDYIQKQRVEYAANLLKSGGLSTTEVSRLSGYGSPVTMNRAFKKHFGLSPSDYRKDQAQLLIE